jgi:hypothetical protein
MFPFFLFWSMLSLSFVGAKLFTLESSKTTAASVGKKGCKG